MRKNHFKKQNVKSWAFRLGIVGVLLLPACKKSQPEVTTGVKTSPETPIATGTELRVLAVDYGNANAAFNAFNSAFLVNSNGQTYYKKSLSDVRPDDTWLASLDILVAEDAYERTGSATHKTLVNNLLNTWLQRTPPPWTWDGWNDDIGWFTMALSRGYLMTGNANFLTQARYGFDMAWARGWDTQYNGGGIWEQQPDKTPAGEPINKQALSNNSLGIVACLIYQSNHDQYYLDRAVQIYDWVWNHIYNPSTGLVYNGVDRNNVVDQSANVYNQGAFVDYANLLYQITGNISYYNDAKRSIEYVKNNMTTGGIITNSQNYLNTWADEFARGLGHFVRDNNTWSTYYSWMQQNANAIWNNRRTDYNVTWNGWDQPTPQDNTFATTKFASAVAWLQYTPASQPTDGIGGRHIIKSNQNGIAIDNSGSTANASGVVCWGANGGANQRWLITQNEDYSWNIVSEMSWKALDLPNSSTTNGVQLVQWNTTRDNNQRWWIDKQADGSYKIWNKASSGALDNSSSTVNGHPLVQWGWNGGDQQKWLLQ